MALPLSCFLHVLVSQQESPAVNVHTVQEVLSCEPSNQAPLGQISFTPTRLPPQTDVPTALCEAL